MDNLITKLKGSEIMDGKIADRSDEISEEEWLEVNEFNREMVQDYLDNQSDLSVQTRPAYKSGLRIFFVWVKDHLKNKDFTEIKKKEFQKIIPKISLKNAIFDCFLMVCSRGASLGSNFQGFVRAALFHLR